MAERIVERPTDGGTGACDQWAGLISRWHRGWQLTPPARLGARSEIRAYPLDDLVVVNCEAAPCAGTRRPDRDADHHDGSELAILVLHQGREQIDWGSHSIQLTAGEAFVWDTRMAGRFRVAAPLDKSTVFLPRSTVSAWWPKLDELVGRGPIPAGQTLALRSVLRALDRTPTATLAGQSQLALASALRELAFITVGGAAGRPGQAAGRGSALWARALLAVEDRLPGAASAEGLALELAISVRSVYQLFADNGTTVRRFVKQRRLARARAELLDPRACPAVAATAQRWGFADQSAFTRAFRLQFGETPGAVARQSRRPA